jgi:hypothetical protein
MNTNIARVSRATDRKPPHLDLRGFDITMVVTWDVFHQIKQQQPILRTKAVPSLSGVTSSRSAVNHLLKSVSREICTLRSVETGDGRPPPVTRWCPVTGIPTAIALPDLRSCRLLRRLPEPPDFPVKLAAGYIGAD